MKSLIASLETLGYTNTQRKSVYENFFIKNQFAIFLKNSLGYPEEYLEILSLYPRSWFYSKNIDALYGSFVEKSTITKESFISRIEKAMKLALEEATKEGRKPSLDNLAKIHVLVAISGDNWKIIDLVMASSLEFKVKDLILMEALQAYTLEDIPLNKKYVRNFSSMKELIHWNIGSIDKITKTKTDEDSNPFALLGPYTITTEVKIHGDKGVLHKSKTTRDFRYFKHRLKKFLKIMTKGVDADINNQKTLSQNLLSILLESELLEEFKTDKALNLGMLRIYKQNKENQRGHRCLFFILNYGIIETIPLDILIKYKEICVAANKELGEDRTLLIRQRLMLVSQGKDKLKGVFG